MVRREQISSWLPQPALEEDDPEGGIRTDDPTYEYQSDSDDEPLEFDSDASSGSGICETDLPSPDEPEWTFRVSGPDPPEYDTEFLPLSTRLGDSIYGRKERNKHIENLRAAIKAQCYEHIAGPGCMNRKGYLGQHISVEEMRGCHTVQGILLKKEDWKSRADDLEFERTSQYHLTGLARTLLQSGEFECSPVRHGADWVISGDMSGRNSTRQAAVHPSYRGPPFHPTCFEIFRQASLRFLGHVDLDTLTQIRDMDAVAPARYPPVCHPRMTYGFGFQPVWQHRVGDEYLAANPVFIPALKSILEAAVVSSDNESFSVHDSPFAQRRWRHTTASQAFSSLPIEIIMSIVSYLSSQDIAALRIASRAFTHLPIYLWHQLILREMPWLYEVWSSDPTPYHWATIISPDKVAFDAERRYQEVLEEEMPEYFAQLVNNSRTCEPPENAERHDLLKLKPVRLPYNKTNWYQLYRGITFHWARLKGLRNRTRIWDFVLQVIDAMKHAKGDSDTGMTSI